MNEREIFSEALQRPATERADYLLQVCGSDDSMRRRLDEMLRETDRLGDFLESPIAGPVQLETDETGPICDLLGDQIGPYRIIDRIGEGGMGVVFLAEQAQPIARRVALKIIKPGMDTRQVVARFEAERQALALMNHPGIARVFDAGTAANGRPYFVMELVEGLPLTTYCDHRQLTLRARLELFVSVCRAVHHAHQKGIIHRDLKPSNVLVCVVDSKDVPKIIDFGVAKATCAQMTDRTIVTGYGQLMGTLEYMSPEQTDLLHPDVDIRSDVYSLGAILYELLAGTPPFRRSDSPGTGFEGLLRTIREVDPPRPSLRMADSNGSTPKDVRARHSPRALIGQARGELDWIVMKSLEKTPAARYETASALADDLERFLQDEAVLARPPSTRYRLRKFVRRHRGAVIAGSFVTLAVVGGVIGTAAGLFRAAWERQARNQAESLLTRAHAAEREVQILAHFNQARTWRQSGAPGQRVRCLEEIAQAARLAPTKDMRGRLRNEAIAGLALPDLRLSRVVNVSAARGRFAFDREFQRFVEWQPGGRLSVRRADDGAELAVFPDGDRIFDGEEPRFSSDGAALIVVHPAAAGQLETSFLDLESRDVRLRLTGNVKLLTRDGRKALSWLSFDQGDMCVYDLLSGQIATRFNVGAGWHAFALSPDGRQLAVSQEGPMHLRNFETGSLISELFHMSEVREVAWHPRGRLVAAFGADTRLRLWDVAANRLQAIADAIHTSGSGPRFSPAGDLMATGGWDAVLRLREAWTGRQVLAMPGCDTQLEFSPDGRWLGCTRSGHTNEIWEVVSAAEFIQTMASPDDRNLLRCLEFSPDGRLLLGRFNDGLRLWNTATSDPLADLPLQGFARFDPKDGTLLTTSAQGIHRWSIRWEPDRPSRSHDADFARRLSIGPPQRTHLDRPLSSFDISSDGQFALAEDRTTHNVYVLNMQTGLSDLTLPVANPLNVALSPNGRWAVIAPWRSLATTPVTIWDASTGDLVAELPADFVAGANVSAVFSGDGKWLATSTEEWVRFWEVGTWKAGQTVRRQHGGPWPAAMQFSSDGSLFAFSRTTQDVAIISAISGEELAVFSLPGNVRVGDVSDIAWSRDGRQLAISTNRQAVYVWNVARLRQELDRLGLDWNAPPLTLGQAGASAGTVEVDLGVFGVR